MMKETDFLINALNEWCKQFEGIHVRYAYDAATEYHSVEVDPESIRRGNIEYKEAEMALWTQFMEAFPEADLLISEPSRMNDMSNCLFDSSNKSLGQSEWERFYFDYDVLAQIEINLTKKCAHSQTNEYKNVNEYALAA